MNSVAYNKSFAFSLHIIDIYKQLTNKMHEYVLSKQLLRSATSIGANTKEGMYGQSKKDFLSKISIALKEAVETEYWLELLRKSKYISYKEGTDLLAECREIISIISASVQTTKKNIIKEELIEKPF